MHTAFVQVGLKEHHVNSYEYMRRVRERMQHRAAATAHLFSIGRLGGCGAESRHARADRRAGQRNGLKTANQIAQNLAGKIKNMRGVSDVYIPQDMDYPALQVNVNRARASRARSEPARSRRQPDHRAHLGRHDRAELLGGSQDRQQLFRHRAVSGKPGEVASKTEDAMPLRAANCAMPTVPEQVADIGFIQTPTEVDHYQLQRISICTWRRPEKTWENRRRKSPR
jgi:HAE1 family hydrophobic/amphiphilic exporter-1